MLIVCGALSGIYRSEVIKRQTEFLKEYIVFLTQTEAMISYCGSEIGEILKNVRSLPLMHTMLTDCCKKMERGKDFSVSWSESVSSASQRKEIRKSDCIIIQNFAETFGMAGSEEEIAKIRLHRTIAERIYSQQQEELKTKTKLCRTIGLFCGTMAAVILV